jgi:hypothetical protein
VTIRPFSEPVTCFHTIQRLINVDYSNVHYPIAESHMSQNRKSPALAERDNRLMFGCHGDPSD